MLASIADLHRGQEVLQPFLLRAANLSTQYDEYLEEDEGDAHLRLPGIHASELSCARKVYYTLTGAKKNSSVPRKWKKRFELGKAIHKMIQDQYVEMARRSGGLLEFEPEVRVRRDLQPIAAELELDSAADGVFTFRDTPGGPVVLRMGLEIKSESPDGYMDLRKPKADHVQQVHLYMRALDLPLMYMMYFNKGNQENTTSFAPWLLAYDDTHWQKIETKCRAALQARDEKKIPDRTEGILCEFCPYRGQDVCAPAYLNRAQRPRSFDPRALRS